MGNTVTFSSSSSRSSSSSSSRRQRRTLDDVAATSSSLGNGAPKSPLHKRACGSPAPPGHCSEEKRSAFQYERADLMMGTQKHGKGAEVILAAAMTDHAWKGFLSKPTRDTSDDTLAELDNC